MEPLHRKHLVQALGACLSIALFVAAAASAATRGAQPAGAATARVVVAQGDTLWSIAKRLDVPGASLPEKVSAIRAMNGLRTSALTPGQELLVPIVSGHELLAQRSAAAGSGAQTEAR